MNSLMSNTPFTFVNAGVTRVSNTSVRPLAPQMKVSVRLCLQAASVLRLLMLHRAETALEAGTLLLGCTAKASLGICSSSRTQSNPLRGMLIRRDDASFP